MLSIQDLLKEKKLGKEPEKKKYITTEFQDYGFRLASKLGNTKQASMYIRMAKEKPRALLEQAFSFTTDYPNAENKHRIFLWKLKELEAEREELLKERNKELRILILDLETVLLKDYKSFIEKYTQQHLLDKKDLEDFLNNEFKKCLLGKSDFKKKVKKYLTSWRWQGSVDDFMKYWTEDELVFNSEVVNQINKLNRDKYKVYISSNQETYRSKFIEAMTNEILKVDGFLFSSSIGFLKETTGYFKKLLKTLILNPNQIYYIGNSDKCIKNASKVGIKTYRTSEITFKKILDDIDN